MHISLYCTCFGPDLICVIALIFLKKSFHFFIVAIQQQSNKLSLIKFLFITKISDYYIGILYSEDSNETIS